MKIKRHNWKVLKQAFINAGHHSGVSLKTISEFHGIPYQSVRRRAAAEKWHNQRLYLWYEKTATNHEKC